MGAAHNEVAGVGAAHNEFAGCACWHALCRAKEISPVVAAVGTIHGDGRGPRRGRGVRVLARALPGERN